MNKRNQETATYAQMGMAAMLPGLVHAVEIMQGAIEALREQLGERQKPHARRGRPPKDTALLKAEGARSGWPADPEERKAEMARRMAMRAKPPAKNSQLSEERKRQWAALSPAKRKARLRAMLAGKKKLPVATLAVAS